MLNISGNGIPDLLRALFAVLLLPLSEELSVTLWLLLLLVVSKCLLSN